jgi:hypothetical protein
MLGSPTLPERHRRDLRKAREPTYGLQVLPERSLEFDVNDPIFGFQFRNLLAFAGVLELLGAFLILRTKTPLTVKMSLIAWIATGFLTYRVGLWFIDYRRPCGCLGNLTDALHIPPRAADTAAKVLLAYLLAGSYFMMLNAAFTTRKKRSF